MKGTQFQAKLSHMTDNMDVTMLHKELLLAFARWNTLMYVVGRKSREQEDLMWDFRDYLEEKIRQYNDVHTAVTIGKPIGNVFLRAKKGHKAVFLTANGKVYSADEKSLDEPAEAAFEPTLEDPEVIMQRLCEDIERLERMRDLKRPEGKKCFMGAK